jgi:hypothetical protein
VHQLCWTFTQMAADLLDGPVTLALPIGLRIVREPTPKPGQVGRASMIA